MQVDKNTRGREFYLVKCKDVIKDIYQRLTEYRPEHEIPFEKTYLACINLIKESAFEQ